MATIRWDANKLFMQHLFLLSTVLPIDIFQQIIEILFLDLLALLELSHFQYMVWSDRPPSSILTYCRWCQLIEMHILVANIKTLNV